MDTYTLPVLHDPVILLGVHRSGTSLIARLLDQLGLFQGYELQEDHESTYFLATNELILKRAGATWDNPAPIRRFLDVPEAADLTVRCLSADIAGRPAAGFLGRKLYAKARGVARLDQAWGWKDPRTVFTLPLWLKLFPHARIVHIVRNGIDVASSLRVREQRELARRITELESKQRKSGRLTRHSLLQRAGFKGSARCLTLEGGFSLWEEYLAESERQLASAANEQMIVVYENFLARPDDPEHGLAAMARFCGLDVSAATVAAATGAINIGRAKAFLSDPELKTFYESVKSTPWMRKYGYSDLA